MERVFCTDVKRVDVYTVWIFSLGLNTMLERWLQYMQLTNKRSAFAIMWKSQFVAIKMSSHFTVMKSRAAPSAACVDSTENGIVRFISGIIGDTLSMPLKLASNSGITLILRHKLKINGARLCSDGFNDRPNIDCLTFLTSRIRWCTRPFGRYMFTQRQFIWSRSHRFNYSFMM